MKKTLIPLVILTLVAVNSCNPSRKATSRAPRQELTLINIGAYANDPAADRARQAFDKTNKGLEELNRLKTYNLEEEELAILRGATVTTTELNRISGVNAPVQGQIDNLQAQANDTITLQDVVMRKHRLFNHQSGTSYSLVLSDDSKIITMSSVSANTLTIPTNALVPFQIGTKVDVIQLGEGQTSITGATGVIVNTSKYLKLSRYGLASLLKTAENSWIVYGDLDTTGLASNPPPGGESSLITGLRAGWKMDETSGTQVNDVLSTYTGSTTATVNQTGKFGRAHSFNGSQMATFGTDVGDLGTNDFTYSCWIYVPTLQSAYNGFIEMQSSLVSFYAMVDADNYIRAVITFDDTNYINIVSNAAISASTWTNIIVTYDRSGNGTMYVNGVAQTDVEDISAHSAVDVQSNMNFRIGRGGTSTWYFNGSIDDVYLWTKVPTQDEIDNIQLGTYPW